MDAFGKLHMCQEVTFWRTIASQEVNTIYYNVFSSRLVQFNNDIAKCARNDFNSPVFGILKISIVYGLYEEICRMLSGLQSFPSTSGKRLCGIGRGKLRKMHGISLQDSLMTVDC